MRRTLPLTCLLVLGCGVPVSALTDGSDAGDACGDAVCSEAESCAACAADCGACPACGDGACDLEAETCEDCPADCGECGSHGACGDGTCAPAGGEDCSSCPADCGACAHCGDGACEPAEAETCASCPADCGACRTCGDGTCSAETCATCPLDCGRCDPCGDGVCAPDAETCTSCPADCGACGTPAGCLQGSFTAYHGNLHSHSSYSDGVRTPGVAFQHARAAGLDFLWMTDHMGQMQPGQWQGCKDQANTQNLPGTFVAGCGYEWVINDLAGKALGHFNLLFVDAKLSVPKGLDALYDTLARCGGDGCLGQWNHPPWPGTFGGYRFDAAGKPGMRLIEFSGRGTWAEKKGAYFLALRNGWRVSPSMNEDNHAQNWGDSKRATGVWATALTRTALREAILAHRTFATEDDTATVALKAEDVCWMGSQLRGVGTVSLTVVARDRQPAEGFARIELLGTDGQPLATHACNGANPCTARFSRSPKAATFWVAQAVQTDGDRLVSAPLWLQP